MADALTLALDGMPPPMIGKPLAVLALGAEAVALPRFAQLAPGATVARAASFMMHDTQPFSPPAAGEGGKIGNQPAKSNLAFAESYSGNEIVFDLWPIFSNERKNG